MHTYRLLPLLAIVLLLGPAGCGLKEYEDRMEIQRKKAKQFDYVDNLLDLPADAPIENNKSLWRFDIFLRLPRGHAPIARTIYTDESRTVALARYPLGQEKSKDDASPNQDRTARNVFIATSSDPSILSEKFRSSVLGAMKDYYWKEFGSPYEPAAKTFSKYSLDLGAEVERDFDRLEFTGPGDLQCQVYIDPRVKVAVIFQMPKDGATAFKETVEACLKTLDTSEEAPQKRHFFMTARKPKK